MLEAEQMSGDNQYRCPRCSGLRDATRQSVLTQMPPFLYLALMRFSYDMNTGERVKVKVPVSYSQHLTVAGVDYDLHGVIYHRGNSVSLSVNRLRSRCSCRSGISWTFCLRRI